MSKNENKTNARSDTTQPSKRKRKTKKYLQYKAHLKSKEFKEVRRIVIERDKYCQFCGRTEDELTLKNGKKLTWNIHHLPEGYKHLNDSPEEEAKYCILLDSSCHRYLHMNPANRYRFTATFTNENEEDTEEDNEKNNNE